MPGFSSLRMLMLLPSAGALTSITPSLSGLIFHSILRTSFSAAASALPARASSGTVSASIAIINRLITCLHFLLVRRQQQLERRHVDLSVGVLRAQGALEL